MGREKKSQQQASACSRGSKKNNRFLRVGPPASVGGRQVWADGREREIEKEKRYSVLSSFNYHRCVSLTSLSNFPREVS